MIGQSAVTTPSRSEQERDLGLELLWLPVESRDNLAHYAGRNLPGATLSADGGLLLRGGRAQDTAFELDGMRVRRLSLPLGMVERFDLATMGYGAPWSDVMGGVLGAVTKSGDNRVHADVDLFDERVETVTTRAAAATVSLPIVKDRLFLLISSRADSSKEGSDLDPEGIISRPPPLTARSLDGGLKLTWLPRAGHRVESLTLLDTRRRDHVADLGIDLDAQPTWSESQWTTSLRWSGPVSARIGAYAQAGFQHLRSEEAPIRCRTDPATCDTIPAQIQKFPRRIQSGNWTDHQIERDTGWQLAAGADALLHEGPRVRERLRLTSRLRTDRVGWDYHRPGDRLFELNQGPEAETVTFANDARYAPAVYGWSSTASTWWSTTSALEGETRLFERLWIVPGLGLSVGGAHADGFTVRAGALTPHLAVAWNAFGNGRTWLHASVHQRAAADLEDLARFGRTTVIQRRCFWDADSSTYSKGCLWSGGDRNTVGMPCGQPNVHLDGTPCPAGIDLARSREYTLGGTQALGWGLRAGLDLVYRRATGLPRVAETNRIWNASGSSVSGYRNGRAEEVLDYSPAPELPDRYLGMTASVARAAGPLKLLLAYSYSRHEATLVPGNTAWSLSSRSITGLAPDDRRHALRALASYDVLGYGSVGAVYSYDTGAPLPGLLRGSFENYQSPIGVNPGPTINDPTDDRRVTRMPDQQRLNLQLRVRAQRLIHVDLDVYLDFLQLFSERGVVIQDSPFSTSSWSGRWGRAGIECRY